jgi:FAD/FMN-containing dehydrogenase
MYRRCTKAIHVLLPRPAYSAVVPTIHPSAAAAAAAAAVNARPAGRALDQSADYRIRALGTLDASWSDYLSGLSIRHCQEADGAHVTTLDGRLVDQAALIGVLNHIYDLGLSLFSVERLLGESPQSSRSD